MLSFFKKKRINRNISIENEGHYNPNVFELRYIYFSGKFYCKLTFEHIWRSGASVTCLSVSRNNDYNLRQSIQIENLPTKRTNVVEIVNKNDAVNKLNFTESNALIIIMNIKKKQSVFKSNN